MTRHPHQDRGTEVEPGATVPRPGLLPDGSLDPVVFPALAVVEAAAAAFRAGYQLGHGTGYAAATPRRRQTWPPRGPGKPPGSGPPPAPPRTPSCNAAAPNPPSGAQVRVTGLAERNQSVSAGSLTGG